MEQGVDETRRSAGFASVELGFRRYQVPELVVFGTVGDLTLGPAGALTDFPEPGYSFAE